MKDLSMGQRWLVFALSVVLAGCASSLWSLSAGREEYLRKHPDVSSQFAEAIRVGRLEVGMTPEMVEAAYGTPGFFMKRGNPATSGTWGYFSCTNPVSQAQFLASRGLTPRYGTRTVVYFEDNKLTHLEVKDNVSEYSSF